MKKTLIASLVVCMAAFSGCSKKQSTEEVGSPVEQKDLVAEPAGDVPSAEQTAPVLDPVPELEITAQQWADASNDFGFNMLRKTSGNAVLSPYSAQRALGMVLDGANGKTAEEMRSALSLPNAKNLSSAGREIEKNMLAQSEPDDGTENAEAADRPEFTVVRIDNRAWVEKSFELAPGYSEKVEAGYGAKPAQLDFVNEPNAARTTINDDIAKTTKDKIKNLIPEGGINSSTRLVLTNAIYFKAPWHDSFDAKKTQKEKFHAAGGDVDVDMMHHYKKHAVYQDEKLTTVELIFSGGEYALVVVLPKIADNTEPAAALENVEATLNASELRRYLGESKIVKVDLALPKFRIEYSDSLKTLLNQLGMNSAFTSDADFSGMGKDLMVSDVIQKAFIDVNENGTEAAAATAAVMLTRALIREPEEKLSITVDHPFVYALVEKTNNTAIFVGRVNQL